MDVHEERALDEGASATNSQSEADVGERSGQPQQSQTPPLQSAVASDADDEKEEDREEETLLWHSTSNIVTERIGPYTSSKLSSSCVKNIYG